MKIQNSKIFVISAFVVVLLYSCMIPQETIRTSPSYRYNFSSLYNNGESIMNPEKRVYIVSDTLAIFYYRVKTEELWASQDNPSDTILNFTVKYALRDLNTFKIVDSSKQIIRINTDIENDYVSSYLKIPIVPQTKYKLIVGFYGERVKSGKRLIVEIDNSSLFVADRYLVKKADDDHNITYNNFVSADILYRIESASLGDLSVNIEYYKFSNYTVVPPYYLSNREPELIEADSTFIYKLGEDIEFEEEGFYLIKASSTDQAGLCLLRAANSYPEIMQVKDMLEPLKIITGNKQYEEIENSENCKLAIDKFWLDRSNNQKFAKEQIRVFYNRVNLANIYFSDFDEGWKSDRGNLYVLLGPPSIVNMSSKGEEWFYGENPDVAGVFFIFDKTNNPYSGTVYKLRRDDLYQTIWSQAVATWRDGRIFTITNN